MHKTPGAERVLNWLPALMFLVGAASVIRVPYATSVKVHVKTEVSSQHAQVGEKVAIEVADNVVVSGYVVIARGADGVAEVASVTPAAANKPGQITLDYKWVRSVDGSKIGVTGTQASSAASNAGGSDTGSTLSDAQNTANAAGVNSNALNQVNNFLGRAKNAFTAATAHAKGGEGAIEPDRAISLTVRNPNGVSISSSLKAPADDDSDVK